ncbi:hypothetical protein [Bartonella sp. DGB2]|uniref:hypothetical protein n=1 Tax=Bartonella sp. DGB2 TaxID=3388426 RepID=UPI00398FBF04
MCFFGKSAEGSQDGSQTFTTPEQSVEAHGVNNIATKFLMALFPPSAPPSHEHHHK